MSSKPNILFWPHVPWKAQYYLRYAWPASRLIQHGYGVKCIDPRFALNWTEEQMAEDFIWADVVVCYTPKSDMGIKLLDMCLKFNKKLVADTDDNTFIVEKSNVSYEWSGTEDIPGLWTSGIQYDRAKVRKNQKFFESVLMLCDALSVTQPELARMHEGLVGKGEIYVLPNSLDLRFYKVWPKRHNKLRIGWQGGASHWHDMKIIEEPLKEIQKKHDVELVFFGQIFPDMEKAFPNAEHHPWVDQDTFHLKLGELDIDIGLCPIQDNDFNRGKSALKMAEYGAFSVPSICSGIPRGPYNIDIELGDRVLVDNTDEAWFNAIDDLVTNDDKRIQIGQNARRTVEEMCNIDVTWKFWAECYEEVNSRRLEKYTGREGISTDCR